MNLFAFKERVVVITGASSGLGADAARALQHIMPMLLFNKKKKIRCLG